MTRRELKEQTYLDFKERYDEIVSECFDIKNENYINMRNILDNSISRGLDKEFGYELHHFIPRSYFKKKKVPVVDRDNLFKLTYSEHFMVHYYAYLCATKKMKSCMSFALLNMKRVCTMNVDSYSTRKLSEIFNSVKEDLYITNNKYHKDKTFNYYSSKMREVYGDKFKLIKANRINSKSNSRCELYFLCNKCGKKYFLKSGSNFISGKFKCDCEKGILGNARILYFGINKKTKKGEWTIQHLSCTPTMYARGSRINKTFVERYKLKLDSWWIKSSIIDIQPDDYNWDLDDRKQLKRTSEWNKVVLNEYAKLITDEMWNKKDVSDNFFFKELGYHIKTIKNSLNLPNRGKFNNVPQFRIEEFGEESHTSKEWCEKLGYCWVTIQKKYTVKKVPHFDEVYSFLKELYLFDKNLVIMIFDFIEFAVENNIDESEIDDLMDDLVNVYYNNINEK